MKTLKFRTYLVKEILEGRKTATWRLFDDKDLQIGDQIALQNWETGEDFAKAEITNVKEKKLKEVNDKDFEGHEKYKDQADILEHYKKYYDDKVNLNTMVKMVKFKLVK